VVNEYVGPERFGFPDHEVEAIQTAFRRIPERYRRSLWWEDAGDVMLEAPLPDPHEVEREDPSEAIRSSEIPRKVAEFFDVIEDNPVGGTLLQFGLHNIAGHFTDDDPASLDALQDLFDMEDALIASGEVSSHFRFIVGRRRSSS
jgi:hypothetical protein